MKKMNSKTRRWILVLVWGALLIFNLIITINNPSYIGWAVVGYFIGGILIMLISNPMLNFQDKFIKSLLKHIEIDNEVIDSYREIVKEMDKKVKGGKKKKKNRTK